jgi:RNA polymerase sigma-70 factor (ECF subfamily)
MARSPTTHPSLLIRLRDTDDRPAWAEFVEIYGPLVYSYGRRRGLQDADASDLVQEVLRSVASAAGRFVYDPARGSFRGWLLTITRNELNRLLRRGAAGASAEGGTTHLAVMAEHPDDADDRRWDREHRERLFTWAAERVRGSFQASTWDAFWRTAAENQPAESVARDLGLSVGAVYIARSRVLARMRELIASVEGEDVLGPGPTGPPGTNRVQGGPG